MDAMGAYKRLPVEGSTGEMASSRNSGVRQFLETDAPYLFWIDTDMGFRPDIIERLWRAGEHLSLRVIGALCYTVNRGFADGMNGHDTRAIPTILDWRSDGRGFTPQLDYEEDSLIRCDATGSAALLIHRSCFERIKEAEGEVWYHRIKSPMSAEFFGEDLSFCLRLRKLNIPVYIDTGVETSHAKTAWVSSRQYRLERLSSLEAVPDATNVGAFNLLAVAG